MDERPNKTPSIIPRDASGKIDADEVKKINDDLMRKLLTEQRLHERDQSMHMARTGKRDVVVHLAVTVLPQVDGHTVIGEREREYEQYCFRLNARQLPVRNATANRAFAELAHFGKRVLITLGMVTE